MRKSVRALSSSGLIWMWISVLVLLVDRYTKLWAMHHLDFFTPRQILPVFNLTLAFNTGAAFSFLHQASGWQNLFLGSIACIVSLVVLRWLISLPAKAYWTNVALCLVLGGALGNAWDRAIYGFVVDFLSFHWDSWYFAIFNIADSAICVGATMLVLQWLWQYKTGHQNKLN